MDPATGDLTLRPVLQDIGGELGRTDRATGTQCDESRQQQKQAAQAPDQG